jgi:hypothetical protein
MSEKKPKQPPKTVLIKLGKQTPMPKPVTNQTKTQVKPKNKKE